jgi:hypothetical protein
MPPSRPVFHLTQPPEIPDPVSSIISCLTGCYYSWHFWKNRNVPQPSQKQSAAVPVPSHLTYKLAKWSRLRTRPSPRLTSDPTKVDTVIPHPSQYQSAVYTQFPLPSIGPMSLHVTVTRYKKSSTAIIPSRGTTRIPSKYLSCLQRHRPVSLSR